MNIRDLRDPYLSLDYITKLHLVESSQKARISAVRKIGKLQTSKNPLERLSKAEKRKVLLEMFLELTEGGNDES